MVRIGFELRRIRPRMPVPLDLEIIQSTCWKIALFRKRVRPCIRSELIKVLTGEDLHHIMTTPPLTSSVAPVTQDISGVQNGRMLWAISIGAAMRLSGTVST